MYTRNKRSIELDLKQQDAREALSALLADADVFVTNYKPTTLTALGVDLEKLHRSHPKLVIASMTAYGHEGPDKDRPGYDGT